jgi:hypothetical protein
MVGGFLGGGKAMNNEWTQDEIDLLEGFGFELSSDSDDYILDLDETSVRVSKLAPNKYRARAGAGGEIETIEGDDPIEVAQKAEAAAHGVPPVALDKFKAK